MPFEAEEEEEERIGMELKKEEEVCGTPHSHLQKGEP